MAAMNFCHMSGSSCRTDSAAAYTPAHIMSIMDTALRAVSILVALVSVNLHQIFMMCG
ncbi:MAG: hypothetical protein IJ422_09305 [Oscillospiraceae bacterium]|nr:hypothetical protein [Oscillospiraceae bacterium]